MGVLPIGIEAEASEEESAFMAKFGETKPSDKKSGKVDKGRYEEFYSHPKNKGGAIPMGSKGKPFQRKTKRLTLPDQGIHPLIGTQKTLQIHTDIIALEILY